MATPATPPIPVVKLGLLNFVNALTLDAIAAVSVAEKTAEAEAPGTSKFQTAMDIIKAEQAEAIAVDPALGTLLNALAGPIINGIVLVNNIKGIFKKKPKPSPTPAPGS